ncbi:DUF4136 domain-containing protein [Mucilaginibacter terrae]|uniref:DUF4136 domain-containing protein n=1 Tax=Mucilaginibacter terrae TaxID=1955052 RepID=A0ABU3GSR6_9SPHI|nr:DUF4136 domain-containing protein [Mucilaginibacter terrae]MDT3402804.1 hypothetical protein [Mucilaginibacter terrae]
MKRLLYVGLMLVMVTAFSACSTGYHYYTAGHDDISLSQYKTFAFAPQIKPRKPDSVISDKRNLGARLNYINNNKYYNNPEAYQKIKDAAALSLKNKGLTEQNGGADLIVRFNTLVDRGTRTSYNSPYWGGGWGWGPGWGWGMGWRGRFSPMFYGGWGGWGGGYAYPTQEHFKEGVLAIELIDARTREPVWIGYSSGELSRDPQKVMARLPEIVEGIFKKLPVRS